MFGVTTVDRSVTFPLGRVRLPGLDPETATRSAPLPPADHYPDTGQLPGLVGARVTPAGRLLAEVGVQFLACSRSSPHIVRARAVGSATTGSPDAVGAVPKE